MMRILFNNCDDAVKKPWLMSEKDGCIYDNDEIDYSENDVWF